MRVGLGLRLRLRVGLGLRILSVRVNSDYLFITVFVMSTIFYKPYIAHYFFTVFSFITLARHYL